MLETNEKIIKHNFTPVVFLVAVVKITKKLNFNLRRIKYNFRNVRSERDKTNKTKTQQTEFI